MKHVPSNPPNAQPIDSQKKRDGRLRKRLNEINEKGEKELASVFATIEKAKSAFRSKKK